MAQLRKRGGQSIPTERFFRSKRAATEFKHAILRGYVVPFAQKTGYASPGHRVVIIDGYAGPGRYDNGQPGSPVIIATAARRLRDRTLQCFFVEKNRRIFARLRAVLAEEEGGAFNSQALWGTVELHLDDLIARADGLPLFLFLDPFGLPLPFDEIVSVFRRRLRGQAQWIPATEVLFRLDAGAIRRTRGVLHREEDYDGRSGTIEALDRVAGGTWWRDDEDRSLSNSEYEDWFMARLLDEFRAKAGCVGWAAAARQREDLQPAYYLVFLTRHPAGMDTFAEILSLAQEKWRKVVFDEAAEAADARGEIILSYADEFFKEDELLLAKQWDARIEANVRGLLTYHENFVVREQLTEVFDGVLGLARQTHLRQVLKRLKAEGLITNDTQGDLYNKLVIRAPAISQ